MQLHCPNCGIPCTERLRCPLCDANLVRVNIRRMLMWALIAEEYLLLLALKIRLG